MKKISIISLFLLVLGLVACKKELLDIKFNLPSKSFSLTVSPTELAGEIPLITTVTIPSLDSIAKANGTSLNKLKSVKFTKITVSIADATAENLDMLDSGSFNITPAESTSEVKIAEFSSVPKGVTSFNMVVGDVNAMDLLKTTQIKVNCKLKTNAPVTKEVKLLITYEAAAVANPIEE